MRTYRGSRNRSISPRLMLERDGGIEPNLVQLGRLLPDQWANPACSGGGLPGSRTPLPFGPRVYSPLRSPVTPAIHTFGSAAVAPPGNPQKQRQTRRPRLMPGFRARISRASSCSEELPQVFRLREGLSPNHRWPAAENLKALASQDSRVAGSPSPGCFVKDERSHQAVLVSKWNALERR